METKETQKVTVICDIYHYRDGKLINHVGSYYEATWFEKVLFHLGLKNLTRSL